MRRVLTAAFVSSVALALSAPGAQAQIRHLTLDGDLAGGPRTGIVQLGIDYKVTRRNGHKRLVPKRVTSFHYRYVPVRCDQDPSSASFSLFAFSGFPGVKVTNKRFSHQYTATWGGAVQSTGLFAGQKMWQARTNWRGTKPKRAGRRLYLKRVSGVLNIMDWDDLRPGGPTNCTTDGPRHWSARQCRATDSDPAYLPLCKRDF
jgi:hypothetical protein